MKPRFLKLFSLLLLVPHGPALSGQIPTPGPESVVVVANSAVEGSLKVAKAYMERRHIPEKNLIVLKAGIEEKISRDAYIETIHNPVLESLIKRKLVDVLEGPKDDFGRKSVVIFSSPIRYIALCYGVPLFVQNRPIAEVNDLDYRKLHFKGPQVGLVNTFSQGNLARNEATVDGELALLLKRNAPMNGFYPNPLHKNLQPDAFQDILRVTRLDGPSPKAVIRMLDSALEGERDGLKGRAYVDQDGRGGGYEIGNTWMSRTADLFDSLGFDLSHDKGGKTFQADARFDAPVLYAGWYAGKANGPFILPGFRFPPGAVAAHLHSFSARTMRDTRQGWLSHFVEAGVAATFGNVTEPYLGLTHHFDLFFAALIKGWNFADAAYYALPGLSWQAVAVGDPLYRPFAVGMETQLEDLGNPAQSLENQYVNLRYVHLLEKADKADEALTLAARAMRETPGPAIALTLARLLISTEQPEKALRALSLFTQLEPAGPNDWGLYATIADTLLELGDPKAALKIYKNLEKQKMPESVQLAFLKRGITAAQGAGDTALAGEWKIRVTPPPPPPDKSTQAPPDPKQQKPAA